MEGEAKEKFIVQERVVESHNVSTLKLALANGRIPSYIPGQFITVYFPDSGTSEGKAYSISSSPDETTLNITVKGMGEFSHRLCAMKSGDAVTASLPYGYFYSESNDSSLVLLAAGIGVCPFRSMIRSMLKSGSQRKIYLFYSAKAAEDIVFITELNRLQKSHKNFKIIYFLTRDSMASRIAVPRRMKSDDVLRKIQGAPQPEFFICGSIAFVRDLWRELRASGVSEEAIYTESFFSR